MKMGEDFQPVDARHHQIENNDLRVCLFYQSEGLFGLAETVHLVMSACQITLQEFQVVGAVIDHQNG